MKFPLHQGVAVLRKSGAQAARSHRPEIRQAARAGLACEGYWQGDEVDLSVRLRRVDYYRCRPAQGWHCEILRLLGSGSSKSIAQQASYVGHGPLVFMERHAAALQQSKQSCISQLRWPRHQGLPGMAGLSGISARHGIDLGKRSDAGACQRQRRLYGRQLHLGCSVRATEKPASVFAMEEASSSQARCKGEDS